MKIYYVLDNPKKRIELNSTDVQVLLFLQEQAVLSQLQVQEFYEIFEAISERGLRGKMQRWAEAGLINRELRELERNGYKLGLITLANGGLTLLKKLGYVKENASLKKRAKKQIDHSLAIRQVVIEVLKQSDDAFYFANNGDYLIGLLPNAFDHDETTPIVIHKNSQNGKDQFHSFSPYNNISQDTLEHAAENSLHSINPYRKNDDTQFGGVIADWLFKKQGHLLHIEVDSGAEKLKLTRKGNDVVDTTELNSIEGKLHRLNKDTFFEKYKSYTVAFVLMDDSNKTTFTGKQKNKDHRIASMKENIPTMLEFTNWKMDVFVVSMKRIQPFVQEIFSRKKLMNLTEPTPTEHIRRLFKTSSFNIFENWVTGVLPKEKFKKYLLKHSVDHVPELMFLLKRPDDQNMYTYAILPILMNEGNTKDMDALYHHSKAIGKEYSKTKIFAIYNSHEAMEEDIARNVHKPTNELSPVDNPNVLYLVKADLFRGQGIIYNHKKKPINVSELFYL